MSSELRALITPHHLDLVAQHCINRYPSEAWIPPNSQYSTTQETRRAAPNLSSSNGSPSPATTTQQSSEIQDALPQFLLLSTAAARFQNSLEQGDVTSVSKDSDFFHVVLQSYQKLQGGWLGTYFRSPKTMEYIKVRTSHN